MGKSMKVNTSLEICAGNEMTAPQVQIFEAMRSYKSKAAIFKKVDNGNVPHLYHIGGKDACKVNRVSVTTYNFLCFFTD